MGFRILYGFGKMFEEMKIFRHIIKINLVLIFSLVCRINVFPQSSTPFSLDEAPIPNNGQPVNDFADVIDDATEQQLNKKIKDFKARTNPPVVLAVATVKTTGDRPIFDYSLAVYRGWKIGGSGDDNPGALLFVAIEDRKYFTQVSRDLEDELPDGIAGQLQRQYLVPAFKQGNYAKGISDTIDAYIRTIEERSSGTVAPTAEQTPTAGKTQPTGRTSGIPFISNIGCCLIVLFILLIFIFSRAGRGGRSRNDRNRWGGGGGFGGGGGALPWIIGSIIANSGSSSSSSGNWGGGDFGGGGGGGSDWGGFGGGGDAGGGGAGGDW